jgi:hypothetical protein
MRRLISNSLLNSSSLLMMIVGQAAGVDGLAVWIVSSDEQRQWKLYTSAELQEN